MTGTTADDPDAWRRPKVCADELFDSRVSFQVVGDELPATLTGFDFLWSTAGPDGLDTIPAAADFIINALGCLKPGGLAVYVIPFDPHGGRQASHGLDSAPPSTPVFRRIDVDRLALKLISFGHEVAQLNYHGEPCGAPTHYGLIVRRGLRT